MLQKHRDILHQIGSLALASLVCVGVMLALYALAGALTRSVLLGALIGLLLAVGNFAALCITVSNAVDRAARDKDPKRAQLEIQSASLVRPIILIIIYVALFRAKVCDPVAAVLPLLFAQVSIKLLEFFRRDGSDASAEQGDQKGGENTP